MIYFRALGKLKMKPILFIKRDSMMMLSKYMKRPSTFLIKVALGLSNTTKKSSLKKKLPSTVIWLLVLNKDNIPKRKLNTLPRL